MSYPTYSLEDLKQTAARHTPVSVRESATGAILLSEYGARILGLFPDRTKPNTLWINKALNEAFIANSWRVGGERLWVAPERHFFYENPRDFDGFHVPAGIDPGTYSTTGETTFENNFSLLNLSTNEVFDNTIARRAFSQINDPYDSNLAYTGVSIIDFVEVLASHAEFCAWSLAQVYCGGPSTPGTAFFPIVQGASPVHYFNQIPATRSDVKNGYARFKIDSEEAYKFTIAPEDIIWENPCKAVYVSPYPKSDQWFAVIKRSSDMPRCQADCLDQAKANPDGRKGAIQSYNHDGKADPADDSIFGEIEIQLLKGVKHGKKITSQATHELLAYCGTKGQILELAKTVLNVTETPELY